MKTQSRSLTHRKATRRKYSESVSVTDVVGAPQSVRTLSPAEMGRKLLPYILHRTRMSLTLKYFLEHNLTNTTNDARRVLEPAILSGWKWLEDNGLLSQEPTNPPWQTVTRKGLCLRTEEELLNFVNSGRLPTYYLIDPVGTETLHKIRDLICGHDGKPLFRWPREIRELIQAANLYEGSYPGDEADLSVVESWVLTVLLQLNQYPDQLEWLLLELVDRAQYTPETCAQPAKIRSATAHKLNEILGVEGYRLVDGTEGYYIEQLQDTRPNETTITAGTAPTRSLAVSEPPQVGDVVDDTFIVLEHLSEGASGKVLLAELTKTWNGLSNGQRVALKWYKDEIRARETDLAITERRLRESKSRFPDNSNLVQIFDSEDLWVDAKPRYLVMEYIGGESLLDYAERGRQVEEVWSVAKALATAVTILHQNQIAHRDIKPQNVVMRPDGTPVLVDLGVIHNADGAEVTASQTFLGTLRYAAPEHLLRQESEFYASDVYSLGATFYVLLTGREPFAEVTLYSRLVLQITSGSVKPIEDTSQGRADLFKDLIFAMMQTDPSRRPSMPDVLEFLNSPYTNSLGKMLRQARLRKLVHADWTDAEFESLEAVIFAAICQPDLDDALVSGSFDKFLALKAVRDILLSFVDAGEHHDFLDYYLCSKENKRVQIAREKLEESPPETDSATNLKATISLATALQRIEPSSAVTLALDDNFSRIMAIRPDRPVDAYGKSQTTLENLYVKGKPLDSPQMFKANASTISFEAREDLALSAGDLVTVTAALNDNGRTYDRQWSAVFRSKVRSEQSGFYGYVFDSPKLI